MLLHRSLVFWFGLFILSFLIWAWADSRVNAWSWRWYPPGYQSMWSGGSSGSSLQLSCTRFFPGDDREYDFRAVESVYESGVFHRRDVIDPPANWLPKLSFKHHVDKEEELVAGRYGHELFECEYWQLAWWVVIGCYLPLWLGLAAWRARRITKGRKGLLGKPGSGYVRVVVG